MQFLAGTKNDTRRIGVDDLSKLVTYIDASYGTHGDIKSHKGGTMSFGIGTIHTKSSKQKLNVKSSTEAEVVGVSDYLPYNLWIRNFLKEQGYPLEKNIIYQDNSSALKIEANGRNSCSGKSRHIDVRYFFTKDRLMKGEIQLEYCTTEKMIADFLTKPLQGKLFQKFREVIMGWKPVSDLGEPGIKPARKIER